MKPTYIISLPILAVLLFTALSGCFKPDYTSFVDPFVGTDAHGHTYPGASAPFGMVQLSPDTRLDGWDGCSGYHYSDSVIYGFSHTHLSGTGIPDYCDILFMPVSEKMQFEASTPDNQAGGYASFFSHNNENASPGFYSVLLDDDHIKAELTVTSRTGLHKYTFDKKGEQFLMLDLKHRDHVLESYLKIISPTEIAGYRRSKGWANDQRVYFVARFSEPIKTVKVKNSDQILPQDSMYIGNQLVAGFSFDMNDTKKLFVKIALSAVDEQGARNNLNTEQPDWDFDAIRKAIKEDWNRELSKIEIKGGPTERKRIFYTALYHSFLCPNIYTDTDGRYLGLDKKIYKAEGFTNYSVFSLWDTYRAAHPLYTFTQPQRTADFIQSFLQMYKHGGLLPVWELAANETYCMIGYHSVSVIADAYKKGYRNFDADLALQAMQHSATKDHFGLKYYKELGFIPIELEHESVSKTLEYAYDDWCIAMMAKEMGKEEVYKEYISRAQNYKNLFDYRSRFIRPRQNGSWIEPYDPKEVTFHYTEANGWQYNFGVQQDIGSLMGMYGGEMNFSSALDSMFFTNTKPTGRQQADITGLIGQYAHGNEPGHHIPYLYALAGNPVKTQDLVSKIMDEFYTLNPDGLIGNEDCGQMSAWYVLSAMGFYQVAPGDDRYTIGLPQFKNVIIKAGKVPFRIKTQQITTAKKYIKSIEWNGKPYNKGFITHKMIMEGGLLEIKLTPAPEEAFVPLPENRAITYITDNQVMTVPVIYPSVYSFSDSLFITFEKENSTAELIRYTIDGSEPTMYSPLFIKPFTILESATIKAKKFNAKGESSKTMTAIYSKYDKSRKIDIQAQYNRQYTAGGDHGLIDGLRGASNFRNGKWQGYQSTDFVAIVDLGKTQTVRKLGAGFLQEIQSWIWMPTELKIEISSDGISYQTVDIIQNNIPSDSYEVVSKDFVSYTQKQARYIKFTAKNFGKIPEWHLGKGGDAFIFVDELVIE